MSRPRALAAPALLCVLAVPAAAQTVTVTTAADAIDVDTQTATIADLPGPDGKVSFSEALIATNNTPGHQTIGFAIPQDEWVFQWAYPGCAVLQSLIGYYWRAYDEVTIDGTTQTAFTGDTNPDGNEVVLSGPTLYLNADNCTLIGFDSTAVDVTGSAGRIEGNTGAMNITVFGGSGTLVKDNEVGTIKLDRSSLNRVVGNTASRVRVLGGGPPCVDNVIGGPAPEDRNRIYGYGWWNSDGYPSGSAIQLFDTVGTVIENNWIGTTTDGLAVGNLACTEGIKLESVNQDVTIRDNLIAGIIGQGTGPHAAGLLFGRGLLVSGSGDGLLMTGNTVGLDANGDPLLGSVTGIDLGDPVTHPLTMTDIVIGGALPGEGNEIAGHIFNGVLVGRNTPAVRLSGNSIHDNGWLGIDLVPSGYGYGVSPNDPLDADTGGSGVQNFPDIAAVLRAGADLHVLGSLHSSPNDAFTLEFFASPACDGSGNGEGETFLGSLPVATDGAGDATFDAMLAASVPSGWYVTATATLDPLGATSEFSACVASVWRDEGYALSGTNGDPLLVGQGDLTPLSPNALALAGAAPSAAAGLFVAAGGSPTPFKGGFLLPVPPLGAPVLAGTDAGGDLALPFTMPGNVPPGAEFWLQWVIQDGAAPQGYALSNGLVGTAP
jgi:hypothetical protein